MPVPYENNEKISKHRQDAVAIKHDGVDLGKKPDV